MYNVYLASKFEKTLVFRGEKEQAIVYLESLRKECRAKDPEGTALDCFMWSDEELERQRKTLELWDSLTDEDKKDFIEVGDKKFIRKIYEYNHPEK